MAEGDREEGRTDAGLLATLKSVVSWGKRQRPYRVLARFNGNDGNLLSAGMSYRAVFAIFAAVWLGFSIAGLWLASRPALWNALIGIIDRGVPGLIGPEGVISEHTLTSIGGGLGWTGVIAAVGLLWTAIGWLNATRLAVRGMFRLGRVEVNAILVRLMDLGLAFAFGLVLIVAAVLSALSTALLTVALGWLGFSSDSFWRDTIVRVTSLIIVVALNTAALAIMFRVLSRVRIPMRMLLLGSVMGSVVLAAMGALSGLLLGGAGRNPLVASFAVFIGLLIWFNLVCRVILLAAAWIAIEMEDHGIDPRLLTPEQRELEREREEARARTDEARTEYERERLRSAEGGWVRRMRLRPRLTRARERLDKALDEERRLSRATEPDRR